MGYGSVGAASDRTFIHRGSSGAGAVRFPLSAVPSESALTISLTANQIWATPFYLGSAIRCSTIDFEVTTVGGAGSVGRCGIYRNTAPGIIYPAELVVDGGEYDCSAVGGAGIKETSVAFDLAPGLYWNAIISGVAAFTMRTWAIGQPFITGFPLAGNTLGNRKLVAAFAYAALPAAFPAGASWSTASYGAAIGTKVIA